MTFNSGELLKLFEEKRHDEISEQFLVIWEYFHNNTLLSINSSGQKFIDQFVELFVSILSQPTFVIGEKYFFRYLSFNTVISNVVAISSTRTTDRCIEAIVRQPNNLMRLLTLYGPRNRIKVDRKALLEAHPTLVSVWFSYYAGGFYGALASREGWENFREHFSFADPRLCIGRQIQNIFFGSTYVGGGRDRIMKQMVNKEVQKALSTTHIEHTPPKRNKYAVISGFWSPLTSVFRNYSAQVQALKQDFHLTLVQLDDQPLQDIGFWDDVRRVKFTRNGVDSDSLKGFDFQVAHFLEVGIFEESIVLANMRLAPIQICSPGHSVSTFGAKVDYFISGEDVEPAEHPERNYSERLVLLPGLGLVHNRPCYEFRDLKTENPVLLINLPAYCQKLNYPFVLTLKKIQSASRVRFKIRFFSGESLSSSNDYLAFCQEIASQLAHRTSRYSQNYPTRNTWRKWNTGT